MTGRHKSPVPVSCCYNGKVVSMDYVPDPKMRFSLACYRVRDNAGTGYVMEGDKVYRISPASKMAKILTGEAREHALAEIAACG